MWNLIECDKAGSDRNVFHSFIPFGINSFIHTFIHTFVLPFNRIECKLTESRSLIYFVPPLYHQLLKQRTWNRCSTNICWMNEFNMSLNVCLSQAPCQVLGVKWIRHGSWHQWAHSLMLKTEEWTDSGLTEHICHHWDEPKWGRVGKRGDTWFGYWTHVEVDEVNKGCVTFQAEWAACAKLGGSEKTRWVSGIPSSLGDQGM